MYPLYIYKCIKAGTKRVCIGECFALCDCPKVFSVVRGLQRNLSASFASLSHFLSYFILNQLDFTPSEMLIR